MFNFAKGLGLSLIAAAAFSSCGVDQSKPENVALGFTQAISQFDFEGAKKFCDKETAGLLSMAAMGKDEMMKKMGDEEKKKMEEAKKNLKSATCKVEGDKATCTVCCGPDGKAADNGEITLVKQDGKWLVSMNKEAKEKRGNTTIEEPMPETPADSTVVETPADSTSGN